MTDPNGRSVDARMPTGLHKTTVQVHSQAPDLAGAFVQLFGEISLQICCRCSYVRFTSQSIVVDDR
jgi:hypothetical protein